MYKLNPDSRYTEQEKILFNILEEIKTIKEKLNLQNEIQKQEQDKLTNVKNIENKNKKG